MNNLSLVRLPQAGRFSARRSDRRLDRHFTSLVLEPERARLKTKAF
jgi:hypothetical protein